VHVRVHTASPPLAAKPTPPAVTPRKPLTATPAAPPPKPQPAPPAAPPAAPVQQRVPAPSHEASPLLVCFLACHVSTMARVEKLRWMLDSVLAQQGGPLPTLHVSWSAASVEVASAVRAVRDATLHAYSAHRGTLKMTEQPERKSQFEHLRELCRSVSASEGRPAWVYFTDDDDVWSESRHALFLSACRAADAPTCVLTCTRKARPAMDGYDSQAMAEELCTTTRDAADVRERIAEGEVGLTHLTDFFDPSKSSFDMVRARQRALSPLSLARSLSPRPRKAEQPRVSCRRVRATER
jgi:hypothetical protein